MEEEKSAEQIVANFQSLSAEGDLLLQKGAFHEAIQVFTKALDIKPEDKHCLVARSRCYIQIGSPQSALRDANAALKDDAAYYKGIYLKAEALYAEGDFELALLYFHRGNKLRPELYEFRVGILKSREAINNSIGDPKRMKIHVPNRLRKTLHALGEQGKDSLGLEGKRPYSTSAHLSSGMEGKLLEELYDDKLYLQELLQDRDFQDFPDEHISQLVNEGLKYLTTRIGFWRQQNPLYARKREVKIVPRLINKKHADGKKPAETPALGAKAVKLPQASPSAKSLAKEPAGKSSSAANQVEYVSSITMLDSLKKSEHQVWASKVSLLELLLDQKSQRVAEQAKLIHDLTVKLAYCGVAVPPGGLPASTAAPAHPDSARSQENQVKDSRLTATALLHAESLYTTRIAALEEQIALDRLDKIVPGSRPAKNLYPLAGLIPLAVLERKVMDIQKCVGMDPNVSLAGLEELQRLIADKVQHLKTQNEIVELQHSKIERLLEKTMSSGPDASLVLANRLVEAFYGNKEFMTSHLGNDVFLLAVDLSRSIHLDLAALKSLQERLEAQIKLNLDIKNLIVSQGSLGVDAVEMNQIKQENLELRQQVQLLKARLGQL
ncbi:Tetratricopeptide repeat protein 25 [Kappamyces sp. JEL0680]|nr:Tetratricopeptide repeat protein 25 [Kappamyces sp. JEL0680]